MKKNSGVTIIQFLTVLILALGVALMLYTISPCAKLEEKDFDFGNEMILNSIIIEVLSLNSIHNGYEFDFKISNISSKTKSVMISLEEGGRFSNKQIRLNEGEKKVKNLYFERTVNTPVPIFLSISHKNVVYKHNLKMPLFVENLEKNKERMILK